MQQQELFKKIFRKNIGEQGNISFLQHEMNTYPYFNIACFFALKETEDNFPEYPTIAARTALFFNNPYLLQIQLNQTGQIEETATLPPLETKKESIKPQSFKPLLPKTESKNNDLLFEPLHASDYFASQGIKLSEEVLENDKLGKQLKSFTEWLKSMKKIHGDRLPEITGPVDSSVQKMAENSNMIAEVETESMAQVYIQQGKYDKARQIYEKLSLQNPSKSAFFAEKIESLK